MKKARQELTDAYAVKVSSPFKDLKENIEAEFYVVLVPDGSRRAQVADVKFIYASVKLRSLSSRVFFGCRTFV